MATLYSTVPLVGAALFVVIGALVVSSSRSVSESTWTVPAILCAAFSAWTAHAVLAQGLLGFIAEHLSDAWGVQIFLDLLCAAGVAFFALAPRLRAARMRPLLWFVAICATGSIALLALLARLLYLERQKPGAAGG